MAAGNWIMYDAAKAKIGDGTFDMNSHTFKVQLHTNSYTPNRATQAVRADLSNELTTANGYTAGGVALATPTFNQAAGVATWDAADPSWTASGGSIGPFRIAVIYDDTAASDDLVCYCILDSADITATTGQTVTLTLSASGILALSGATS